ncbi:MAG: hypothetical protein LIO79_08160 [Rikenellaceae bacterium]|nr:hypothetical protein [Rikenellaceae bacterium]
MSPIVKGPPRKSKDAKKNKVTKDKDVADKPKSKKKQSAKGKSESEKEKKERNRLCADDVMTRENLVMFQDTYAE